MKALTGVSRAAAAGRRRALGGLQWLGLAEGGPAEAPKRRVSLGNVPRPVRRWGRAALVRGLASAAFRPGHWAAGLAVLAVASPGPWWLICLAGAPLALPPGEWIYDRFASRSSSILSDVSSRLRSMRLARRVRRRWPVQMTRLGLTRQTVRRGQSILLTPALESVQLTDYGLTCEVNLTPYGLPVGDLAKHRERLESALVCDIGVTKVGHGQAAVEFRHTDPLSRPVPVETLPAARRYLHVVTRVAEDGRGVDQDVLLPQLVIGSQGSGKSTELRSLLYQLQQAGIPHRVRAFDPKGGMELGSLREAAHLYEARPNRWPEFLGQALTALAARQRSLSARGWDKLTSFTERDPLDILVIDELLAVIGQRNEPVRIGKSGEMKAADALDLYLSQGRAAGFTAIALSQLGQKEIIGSARALFPHLTVLRLPQSEKEIVDRLLGSAETFPAHLIPPGPRFAGVGFTRTAEGRIVRSRGALLSDEQWREVVARMAADKQRRTEAKQQRQAQPTGVS